MSVLFNFSDSYQCVGLPQAWGYVMLTCRPVSCPWPLMAEPLSTAD